MALRQFIVDLTWITKLCIQLKGTNTIKHTKKLFDNDRCARSGGASTHLKGKVKKKQCNMATFEALHFSPLVLIPITQCAFMLV